MGKGTGIAWCDHTFNPWWGCVEVSPACDNCYARTWDARFEKVAGVHWGKDVPRRFFGDKHWNEPLRWNAAARKSGKRTLVFCASMADVFEQREDLGVHRQRLWELIRNTRELTWLLLTKRPNHIGRMLPTDLIGAPNIWLGTTVESPAYLWRADALIENHQAAVRFVSMEPLVERTLLDGRYATKVSAGINWVITGCESGDGARSTPSEWYRALRDESAGRAPFFLKQAPRGADGITSGDGSWLKLKDGIVEIPYLDGVQHAAFPEVR